jgi:hypothetical protein
MSTLTLTADPVETLAPDVVAVHLAAQARFDAIRPACPSYCVGECPDTHDGYSVTHGGDRVVLPCKPEVLNGLPATVSVHPSRYDALDEPSEEEVELYIGDGQSVLGDHVPFTAQQAYDLGAALMAAARKLSGELTVPAADVKIGDWLKVDGEWMQVFLVIADEASDTVQICVTADPDEWSDFDYRDENPEQFKLADTVRIRGAAPVGGPR